MKKTYLFILIVLITIPTNVFAQEKDTTKYRRSSLYTMLIKHPDLQYGNEIAEAFYRMPNPDKFDDHNLPDYKEITSSLEGKTKKSNVNQSNQNDIMQFFDTNGIPRLVVAKWFNRDSDTGGFDMTLVGERGNYDASMRDVDLANLSSIGEALLADAGEDLIEKTFVIVNDITYFEKKKATKAIGGGLRIAGIIAEKALGVNNASTYGDMAGAITEQFAGFSVRITSYLYRLDWTEEVAATFYQDYWFGNQNPDSSRKTLFENSDLFKVKYVGSHSTSAGNISYNGITKASEEDQILKVCVRALDKSIVELQRQHDEFKVNVPIYQVNENGEIFVQIGLKEGINERSRFAVLETIETPEGRLTYKKVGEIAPVKGQIWDNRFMAAEEAAEIRYAGEKNKDEDAEGGNPDLTATMFKKISGITPYPGLLIREVTIKTDSKGKTKKAKASK